VKNRGLIVALLVFGVSVFFFWYFFRIFVYIMAAGVLSLLGEPVVAALHRVKIGRFPLPLGVCAFLTLLLMIGILAFAITGMAPLLGRQASLLAEVDIQVIMASLEEPVIYFESTFREWELLRPDETISERLVAELVAIATFDRFSNFFTSVVNIILEVFIAFIAISFITFFFLKEKQLFTNMVLFFTPEKYKSPTLNMLMESKALLRRYFAGLFTDLVAVFILISLGMWMLGLKNALVIGFFAGILNTIPYVGPIIATFIGILLAISINLDMDFYTQMLPLMIKIAGVFIIVNTIDIGVLQPMIYSKSVRSHPLEIFIVFMIAGMLAGVFGMIIAIPAYTVIRIFAKVFISNSAIFLSLRKELEL
jgi:predicted PurR-regulated permease PerM